MQLVEKRGHYYVYDGSTVLIKTNDKAEAESLLASSGDANGKKASQKVDSKEKESTSEEKNSAPVVGVSKKDTKSKGKKK